MMFMFQNQNFVKFVMMYMKFYYVKKNTQGWAWALSNRMSLMNYILDSDELYFGFCFGRANVCFIFVIHIIWGLLSMFKLVSFTPSTTILPLEVWSSIFKLGSLEVRILSIHQFFVVSCWKFWLQVKVYWHRQFATN